MEIHKPRPVRNWREFLKEYAIIVLGVATALAAEQGAEWLHDRAKADEARIHIRAEIAVNLRLIALRAATEACVAKRLDEVDGLIAASSAGKLPGETVWISKPQPYAMPDGRYRAATQSGAVSLFTDQEQTDYGRLYTFFATYFQFEIKEQDAWADLRMLEDQPPPSPALDVRLRAAIKQARLSRWTIQRLQTQIMIYAAQSGIAPEPQGNQEVQAICLPLHTPRAEAVKAITAGRWDKGAYDEPWNPAAEAPPPEEAKMEIHKPRPVRNWREFLKEYAIIVLGVLTALAAEQAVEALHNHERAAQARASIRAEIADNIALINRRSDTEACVSRRLNEVEGLIRTPATGSQAPVWIGHPPNWLMTHDQYTAAVQSGAVSLLSNLEQVRYSLIYSATEDYSQAEKSEQAAWADLRMLELHPALTPAVDGLLRSALQKARTARWQTEISARVARTGIAALGIEAGKIPRFPQTSACIPLNTTRADGEKLVVKGRPGNVAYDEP